ncbi:L-lactate permease [Campylobacter fetus]|uniref:L-lactate permease n=1 Tax=Campylobacter fetus TaxID=196 RepID=UPI003AF539C2
MTNEVNWLHAAISGLPIILFFTALVWLKLKGWVAAAATVTLSFIIAITLNDMSVIKALASFAGGFLKGLWPIAWIIIAAIFLYKLSDKSGYFNVLKHSVMSITPDHRIQVILIAFCFGSFLEGAIGFGGPVAITAALLVGLGLRPLYAAGLCLIANTAPVAFGAVGIPIIAMAQAVNVDQNVISAMVGRMLPPVSLFVPFFIVFLIDGFKGVRETFPAIFVATISFAATQFYSSNHIGPELPDIISAIVSIIVTSAFLKIWKPKNIFRVDRSEYKDDGQLIPLKDIWLAWAPFIILVVAVIIWQIPSFKALFKTGGMFEFTGMTFVIYEDIKFRLDLILTAGTAILLAGIVSIFILSVNAKTVALAAKDTLKEMKIPVLTIGLVVAYAVLAEKSGQASLMGTALAQTGDAFAFFSPIIGWLGVFLTGSDTSSNLLFGSLQVAAANALMNAPDATIKQGLDVLFLAANTFGGVVGKMISPQSIAIACAAVGLVGKESDLFRFTVKYSIGFIIACGAITYIIAHWLPFIIPTA